MRFFAKIAYDGSRFQGSASQKHNNTVQDAFNLALKRIGVFKPSMFSSRTDKGVHARGASLSFDCDFLSNSSKLKEKLNKHLLPHIQIKFIKKVPNDFQVRFDAKARIYHYVICHENLDIFKSNYMVFKPIFNINKIDDLLKLFCGIHDFSAFMKMGSNTKNPVREIYEAKAFRFKNFSIIKFKANGFLRAQIRLMISSIFEILNKNYNEYDLKIAIEKQKPITRIPFSPNGLYLSDVIY